MLNCVLLQGGRMAERDIIMLKQKELKQLHVIHKVLTQIHVQNFHAAHIDFRFNAERNGGQERRR